MRVGGHQQRLEATKFTTCGERGRPGVPMQVGGVDHGVDDQRADIGDAGRQDAGEQRETASAMESVLLVVQTRTRARRL